MRCLISWICLNMSHFFFLSNLLVLFSDYPHRLMEEWDSKGVYVNYWETVSCAVYLV